MVEQKKLERIPTEELDYLEQGIDEALGELNLEGKPWEDEINETAEIHVTPEIEEVQMTPETVEVGVTADPEDFGIAMWIPEDYEKKRMTSVLVQQDEAMEANNSDCPIFY